MQHGGLVPKPQSDKLRLIVNMRYVNEHLVKRVFKFEGLSDIADMVEKDDDSVSYNRSTSHQATTMCLFIPTHDALWDSNGGALTTNITTSHSVCLSHLGCSQRLFVS